MNKQFRVVDLTYMAVCAALIAVCAWITVPAAVPFTLQIFGVFCVLGLLGGKRGTVAILVYILLGAVGLPVFSGFNGGMLSRFSDLRENIEGFYSKDDNTLIQGMMNLKKLICLMATA